MHERWSNDEDDRHNYDIGMIALDRNLGAELGKFEYRAFPTTTKKSVVYFPSFGQRIEREYTVPYHPKKIEILHYPSYPDSPPGVGSVKSGVDQQYSDGPVSSVDDFTMFYDKQDAWASGGSSGAPVFVNETIGGEVWENAIVGIHIRGERVPIGDEAIAEATRLDDVLIDWIDDFKSDRAGDLVTDRPASVNHDRWFRAGFEPRDLEISDKSMSVGQEITVSAPVFDGGTATASDVVVRFAISTNDAMYDSTDTYLGDATITSIAPFESEMATLTFTVPDLGAGWPRLVWRIDPDNTVNEFDSPFNDIVVLGGDLHSSNFGEELVQLVNDPPVFDSGLVTHLQVYEGQRLDLTASATDPEGLPVTYALVANGFSPNLNTATGRLRWNPGPADQGSYTAFITAADGYSGNFVHLSIEVKDSTPQIDQFTTSHASIYNNASQLITLEATGVSVPAPGESVDYVEFFVDRNQNGQLDLNADGTLKAGADDRLSLDSYSADGWSWKGAIGGLANGTRQLFARAVWDSPDYRHYGDVESISIDVVAAPTIPPVAMPFTSQQVPVTVNGMSGSGGYPRRLYRLDSGDYVTVYVKPLANFDTPVAMRKFSPTGQPLGGEVLLEDSDAVSGSFYGFGFFLVRPDGQVLLSGDKDIAIYNPNGSRIGQERTLDIAGIPRWAAADQDGNFVAIYTDINNSITGVRGRRFNWQGEPLSDEFVMYNEPNRLSTDILDLAMSPNGTYAIASRQWINEGPFDEQWQTRVQVFAPNGVPLSEQIVVTKAGSYGGDIQLDLNGQELVVVYPRPGVSNVFDASRYALDGTPLGKAFQVNTSLLSTTQYDVSLSQSGWLTVVRDVRGLDVGDSSSESGVYAQVVDDRNVRRGPEFRVPTITAGDQLGPFVTQDEAGDFAVLWTDSQSSGDTDYAFRSYYVNLPPQISPLGEQVANPNAAFDLTVQAMDPESDSLTYALLSGPANATIQPTTGRIQWTPPLSSRGQTFDFKVQVTDDGTPNQSSELMFPVRVEHPDIVVHEAVADGSEFGIHYEIVDGVVPAFDFRVFRSSDGTYDGSDVELGRVRISDLVKRRAGSYVRTVSIGDGNGQIPLPGFGAPTVNQDFQLLVVADAPDLITENDVEPIAEDNLAKLTGVYHESGGAIYVFGGDEPDTLNIETGSVKISLNGVTHVFDEASVSQIQVRLGGEQDQMLASETTETLRAWGGPGDDRLVGGTGINLLSGGPGADSVLAPEGSSTTIVRDSEDDFNSPVLAGIGITHDTTPTIRWQEVAMAVAYDLILEGPDGESLSVVFHQQDSWTPTEELASGTYRVQVRAVGDSGLPSAWSSPMEFTVDELAPEAPQLLTPLDEPLPGFPIFEWAETDRAATYELRFADGSSGTVAEYSEITTTSFRPDEFLPEGSLVLRLRARNADGEASPWTSSVITVEHLVPAAPAPLSPSGTTLTSRPILRWAQAEDAAEYELILHRENANGTQTKLFETSVERSREPWTMTQDPGQQLPAGDYSWQIRGVNGAGVASPWAMENFTVDLLNAPPSPPSILEVPAGDEVENLNFRWSVEPLAMTYDLRVQSEGATVFQAVGLVDNQHMMPSQFLSGVYEAQVRAQNAVGAGDWGTAVEFSLAFNGSFPQWQNPSDPMDVNDDQFVTAIDALLVINALNQAPGVLPSRTEIASPYLDSNGDNFLSSLDALLVINTVNSSRFVEGEAEADQLSEYSVRLREGAFPWNSVENGWIGPQAKTTWPTSTTVFELQDVAGNTDLHRRETSMGQTLRIGQPAESTRGPRKGDFTASESTESDESQLSELIADLLKGVELKGGDSPSS